MIMLFTKRFKRSGYNLYTMFSIFRKRKRGQLTNRELKKILTAIKNGGQPCLVGFTLSEAQAAKIKEALGGTREAYYRLIVEGHTVRR